MTNINNLGCRTRFRAFYGKHFIAQLVTSLLFYTSGTRSRTAVVILQQFLESTAEIKQLWFFFLHALLVSAGDYILLIVVFYFPPFSSQL